jgi:hypothetical protein
MLQLLQALMLMPMPIPTLPLPLPPTLMPMQLHGILEALPRNLEQAPGPRPESVMFWATGAAEWSGHE